MAALPQEPDEGKQSRFVNGASGPPRKIFSSARSSLGDLAVRRIGHRR